MSDKSNIMPILAKHVPGLFTRESVEELVSKNEMTYESASEALCSIENSNAMSTESSAVDIGTIGSQEEALKAHFASVKFEAMLKMVKEDDTLQYEEFVNLDNARNKVISEVIAKYEDDFNTLLNELKTTGGVNADELDKFICTKLSITDVK